MSSHGDQETGAKMVEFEREYFEEGPYAKRGGYGALEAWTKRFFLSLLKRIEKSKIEYKNGRGKHALEIGYAYGYVLGVLKDLGYEIYGLDISKYAIKKAKVRLPQGNFVVQDIQKGIPFKTKFDFIVCMEVLEHLRNPEIAIKNCYEALNLNGIFLASTPNKKFWRRYIPLLPSIEIDETHVNVRTAGEWKRCFSAHKWRMLKVATLQPVPLVWRSGKYFHFEFPLGETVFIMGVK